MSVLDQLKLPHESVYIDINTVEDTWSVIRKMQVRGAPLIAIVAALGLAVVAEKKKATLTNSDDAANFLLEQMTYLRTSRPTAVNLFTATDELSALVKSLREKDGIDAATLLNEYVEAAEAMLAADVAANKAMGRHGAQRIMELVNRDKLRVLTICNTGSLATAGFGTALGVVRALHETGNLERVYACETRPYNQGARLTAYEIVQDNLPGTLIGDSMASALMSTKGVDCVVVGADRVAANGDTANKIGTFQLAIAAKYHKVPFFVAAPTTTLDLTMSTGEEIEIEQRPAIELTSIFNQRIAPDGIDAWNPAFDVTPCALIKGIITEIGVIEDNRSTVDAEFDGNETGVIPIAAYLSAHASEEPDIAHTQHSATAIINAAEHSATPEPSGYHKYDESSIGGYILKQANLADLLKVSSVDQLKINEVGDGNLNYVYLVEGTEGRKIVVKQALPYVRCVGESWPLTLRRAYFEYSALVEEAALTGGQYLPEIYHFSEKDALIAMRFIEAPHIILRKALIHNQRISSFAAHMGDFMARTLFGSSALNLDGGQLRSKVAHWSQNIAMCALTEKVVFTDPYCEDPLNRWTSPQLDGYAASIKADTVLKLAASYHKTLFLTSTQALLHGDLHTGSIMAKEGSTYVIDPEFAFYGPMGFDLGAMLANLFLSYFSKAHDQSADSLDYSEWLLQQIVIVYETFESTFLDLWNLAVASEQYAGELFHGAVYKNNSELLESAQAEYMATLWRDALGFAGLKMIRRVVGIAHVEDMDSITNADDRAKCEKKALIFGRTLVMMSFHGSGHDQGRGLAQQQHLVMDIKDATNVLARRVFNEPVPEEWPM